MNPIAQRALDRAKARPAVKVVPVAQVEPVALPPVELIEPVAMPVAVPIVMPVAGVERVAVPAVPEDRVLRLEGRHYGAAIVLDAGLTLREPGGPELVLATLRRATQGKPLSFARGVAEVIVMLERELGVARG